MANVKYNSFGRAIAKNDMDTVTIKAMFCDPSYIPDPDTEVYLSDISANRASGSTDLTVAGLTFNLDNTDNRTEFDVNDLTTGAVTISGGTDAVVFYIDTTVESTSELLTYNDLLVSAVKTTVYPIAGTLTAQVDTDGIFSI